MTLKKVAPYGAWESHITTELIVSESISLGDVLLSDGNVFWQEMRPLEGGRYTIMHQSEDGAKHEILSLIHI